MPFSLTEYKFGQHRGLMIYHSENKHHIDLLPAHGALIARMELFGHELTAPIENANQLMEKHEYRNFWLIPFQNRVADGRYAIDGNMYQLPINEKERNNALHGFFSEVEMESVKWDVATDIVSVSVDFSYKGQVAGYPFPFSATINYQIMESGTVKLSYQLINTGDRNLPFTVGWHPYFKLDGDRSDWKLAVDKLKNHPLNERNLPEGEATVYEDGFDLSVIKLDHCFEFAEKPYRTKLSSGKMTLEISQSDSLPFVQIFTPPSNSIAIEPVSSAVDAFNTGVGLEIVEPGKSVSGNITISLTLK